MEPELRRQLVAWLGLEERQVYDICGMLDLSDLWDIHGIDGYSDLRDPPYTPVIPPAFRPAEDDEKPDLFAAIRERDVLVHYPYESFAASVERFIQQAEEALKRLTDFLARLDSLPARQANPEIARRLQDATEGFSAHICHDVNSAAAIGVMFDLVRALNSAIDAGELGATDALAVRQTFDRFDRVLGVLALRRAEDEKPPVPVDEIEQLIAARRAARLARNFA